MPMDRGNNVATFRTAVRFCRYDLFCEEVKLNERKGVPKGCQVPESIDAAMKASPFKPVRLFQSSKRRMWSAESGLPITKSQAKRESKRLKVSTDHKIVIYAEPHHIQEGWQQLEQGTKSASHTEELLLYHHHLSHTGFDKLREMARQGVIPTYLAKAPAPRCMACMYSKATRQQWHNKQQDG